MAKVYVARCIVKKDGKRYEKGNVIEGLTADEIAKGLAQKWLEAVGSNEPPKVETVKSEGKKNLKGGKKPVKTEQPKTEQPKTERDALIEKALELEIDIKDEMTDDEIRQLITEKEAGAQ